MMLSLFCLYVAAIFFPTDAKSHSGKLVDFAVYEKKLQGLHAQFHQSAKTNGYVLTETHFETKVKTICTHSGCSSSAKEKKGNERKCTKEWKKFGGNCYKLLSKSQNQNSAKSACKSLNADLADITSESENVWIQKTFSELKGKVWIGATDKTKEGEWRWSSSGKLLTFGAWYKGEPNNDRGIEDCAIAKIDKGKFLWNDVPCSYKYPGSLCKKKE
ncbi:CD209 antigen-like protein C [Ostrea edulis]|uniref:CD209 antigen-like protein C n=1 Tax=Ostrea edulis TaxID=37623 RepID=UPI0024AEFD17|nr:CD209 antigen-like protein C [Ostrea edulis]